MKSFIKFFIHGFGLADEVPVKLSIKEVQNLIELQQLENPTPGQILDMAEWCIGYLKRIDNKVVKVLLKEIKDSI